VGGAHRVVGQIVLVQVVVPESLRRAYRRRSEARRGWRGVGIESRVVDTLTTGPEAGARTFVRVGIELDRRRHVGHGTARRERRRLAPRETGHGEIEAAPEEMDRAALADEARAEPAENTCGLNEY